MSQSAIRSSLVLYWSYVLFDARGEPIEVKLTKRQAKDFVKMYSERTKLLPIKVSEGDLALPPHVRNLYVYEGSIRILLLMAGKKSTLTIKSAFDR
jgi:hypothetical protein